jgi:hypothetical protein
MSGRTLSRSVARSAAGKPEVKPTWWSSPSASYRPSSSEPTTGFADVELAA